MSFEIEIENCVKKEVKKIPKKEFERIKEVVESMKTDPFIGDRQKIQGTDNEFRRRIGNWRIFFLIDVADKRIIIKHIKRRDSKTYSDR